MVELDVSLTKDSQVIVYHDLELVEQTSNLIIPIKDITYEQLISNNFQPVNRKFNSMGFSPLIVVIRVIQSRY